MPEKSSFILPLRRAAKATAPAATRPSFVSRCTSAQPRCHECRSPPPRTTQTLQHAEMHKQKIAHPRCHDDIIGDSRQPDVTKLHPTPLCLSYIFSSSPIFTSSHYPPWSHSPKHSSQSRASPPSLVSRTPHSPSSTDSQSAFPSRSAHSSASPTAPRPHGTRASSSRPETRRDGHSAPSGRFFTD